MFGVHERFVLGEASRALVAGERAARGAELRGDLGVAQALTFHLAVLRGAEDERLRAWRVAGATLGPRPRQPERLPAFHLVPGPDVEGDLALSESPDLLAD